LLVPLEKLEGF